jgi:uncharacterized phage-like protein YoqJ
MIVSFTGHRPHWNPELDKLGTGYSITNDRALAYSNMLLDTLRVLIQHEGANTFITGGALGIDQIAFWTVERLKKDYGSEHIQNILAVPFESQYSNWKSDQLVSWYHKMVKRADVVVNVDTLEGYDRDQSVPIGAYSAYKMQVRNEYMVNQSNVLIAVWDGSSGGTGNCVKYAKEYDKRIIQLQPIKFTEEIK